MHKDSKMIDRIGNGGMTRLDTGRLTRAGSAQATGTASSADATAAGPANPAAALAAAGPPIDSDRVAALRAAIANGSYRVDADAIADRMIAADLPATAA